MNKSVLASGVYFAVVVSGSASCSELYDHSEMYSSSGEAESTSAMIEPGWSANNDVHFSEEPNQSAVYYLCIDACDPQITCWVSCLKNGKVTNCLQAGLPCNQSAVCGNKKCEKYENCSNCPDDCVPKPIVTESFEEICTKTGEFEPLDWQTPTYYWCSSGGQQVCCKNEMGHYDGLCTLYKTTKTTVCTKTTVVKQQQGGPYLVDNAVADHKETIVGIDACLYEN